MISFDIIILTIVSIIGATTPLLLAATGELVTEKSGVLNLGVEGMMLMGAVAGVGATIVTDSWFIGLFCAAAAGAAMSLLFGFLTLTLMANQVASGLALTIFGTGLSAVVGAPLVGKRVQRIPDLEIAGLTDLPVIGPIFFSHDPLVYFSLIALVLVSWFLFRTRAGLALRAVGESHDSAHAIGYRVISIRYGAVAFGGVMAGLAGAYLSLAATSLWAEGMTAGRGWIALALIVFAAWRPMRLLLGAYLFGIFWIGQLAVQGFGWPIATEFMGALPYIVTILVLVIISRDSTKFLLDAPACIGKAFHPTA